VVVSAVGVMGQEWMGLGADVDCSHGSVDLEVWKWWKLVTECCLVYMFSCLEEHEVLQAQHLGEWISNARTVKVYQIRRWMDSLYSSAGETHT
jgi:hypothetical protein